MLPGSSNVGQLVLGCSTERASRPARSKIGAEVFERAIRQQFLAKLGGSSLYRTSTCIAQALREPGFTGIGKVFDQLLGRAPYRLLIIELDHFIESGEAHNQLLILHDCGIEEKLEGSCIGPKSVNRIPTKRRILAHKSRLQRF